MNGPVTATLRSVGVLNEPSSSRPSVTAKRPSSDESGSVSTALSTSMPLAFASRNFGAICGTLSWMRLMPTPTLWKRLSVNSAWSCSIVWQETQRPSPRNTSKPRIADSLIAVFSPPKYQRSNGESPATMVRSKLAIAILTCSIVIAAGSMPNALLNICAYAGSLRTIFRIGSWLGRPISTGLTNGCCDWSSRSAERPSQNWLAKYAALTTVGALRVPVSLLMPSEVLSGLSVKALPGSWQVAQLTSPVELKRLSLNNWLPKRDLLGRHRVVGGHGQRRQAERAGQGDGGGQRGSR